VTEHVRARKVQLRTTVLAARGRISDTDRAQAAAAIAAHAAVAWPDVRTVAAYLSFGTEPPTHELIGRLVGQGARVLIPVIDGADLDWAEYTSPAELAPGRLGISEPTGPRLGAGALADADLVIVPALAVDHAGHRLGRGQGYYDRALGDVTVPIVAVIYDDELLDEVPAESHDRRVDRVLRPAGLSS